MALTTREFAPKKPWPRRVAPFGAGAAAVIIVAVIATSGDGGETPEAATTLTESSTTVTTPATTTAAKGSLVPQTPAAAKSPVDADWLSAAPQNISWQRVDGVPLPFSASDGPSRIDGAVAEGYTHTPQGAAIAAIQIGMRMIFSPDFESVVNRQTAVSDTERTQLITARSGQPNLNAAAVTATTMQPSAFKIGSYTDTDATIYFAYPTASGTFRIARMAVTWTGGDWKYTGRMSPEAPELPDTTDLSAFTAL
jgi:hypothetical protein